MRYYKVQSERVLSTCRSRVCTLWTTCGSKFGNIKGTFTYVKTNLPSNVIGLGTKHRHENWGVDGGNREGQMPQMHSTHSESMIASVIDRLSWRGRITGNGLLRYGSHVYGLCSVARRILFTSRRVSDEFAYPFPPGRRHPGRLILCPTRRSPRSSNMGQDN